MKKFQIGLILIGLLIIVGCDSGPQKVDAASKKLPDMNSPEAAKGGTVIQRDESGDK
jgi:outer membrane murein-binding lipoprotein Lpp